MKRSLEESGNRKDHYGTRTFQDRHYAWSARMHGAADYGDNLEPGFSLVTLSDYGMLDPTAKYARCPGGCYPESKEYHGEYLHSLGGDCDAVWLMGNLNIDFKSGSIIGSAEDREEAPTTADDVAAALVRCLLVVRDKSASFRYVTAAVPVVASEDAKGEPHQNMFIMRLDFADRDHATVRHVLYDPWSHSDKYATEEAIENFSSQFMDAMERMAEVVGDIYLSNIRPERSDEKFGSKGVQGYERPRLGAPRDFGGMSVMDARRASFWKATKQIAKDMGSKFRGYCVSYSMMMLVLAAAHPLKTTSDIDRDIVWAFHESYLTSSGVSPAERFAEMPTDLSSLVPVLRKGLGALARTFGITVHNRAQRSTGKMVPCCPKSEEVFPVPLRDTDKDKPVAPRPTLEFTETPLR